MDLCYEKICNTVLKPMFFWVCLIWLHLFMIDKSSFYDVIWPPICWPLYLAIKIAINLVVLLLGFWGKRHSQLDCLMVFAPRARGLRHSTAYPNPIAEVCLTREVINLTALSVGAPNGEVSPSRYAGLFGLMHPQLVSAPRIAYFLSTMDNSIHGNGFRVCFMTYPQRR